MKNFFFAFALLASIFLSAQEKGASPIPKSEFPNPKSTRAVVVGISDYQDPKIPDLRFADRDAIEFATWLRSPAGGKLPEEDVMLLTNKDATSGKIAAGLTWLVNDSKAGDRAIIYFSGHGDVENVTDYQRGYLLAHNSPPTMYMAGGAFEMRVLQDVISTLSQREVQVVMVSDACRAGKLAGSENGGPQATTAALSAQFAKEVKILSCQPDEFSLEGEQWGGGRGAFSYHLVDGLYGMADQNADLEVNLLEIQRYLQDAVARDAAPQSQVPMTVGNPKTHLSEYDRSGLDALLAQKATQAPALHPVESKSFEAMALATADTSTQQLYAAFEEALRRGDLLNSAKGGRSADDYYRALMAKPEIARLHGLMTRNFAAALVDESQEVTNKLLKSDPQIVSDAVSRPFVYDHIPGYLARAIELLGEQHFLFKHLKAKQLFFEAKTYRSDRYPGVPSDTLSHWYLRKLDEALRIDSMAAYILLDLGMYQLFSGNFEKANGYLRKTLELSPNNVAAHYFLGSNLAFSLEPTSIKEGISYLEKAVSLDSTFYTAYVSLGVAYGSVDTDAVRYRRYLEKYVNHIQPLFLTNPDSVPLFYLTQLGNALWKIGRPTEAETVLLHAVEASKGHANNAWFNLMAVYHISERWDKMIWACKKDLELTPMNWEVNYTLGFAFLKNNQPAEAEAAYKRMASVMEDTIMKSLALRALGDLYLMLGRQAEAETTFRSILQLFPAPVDGYSLNTVGRAKYVLYGREAMEETIRHFLQKDPENPWANYQIACIYALAGDAEEAINWLEKSTGYVSITGLLVDADFHFIRHTPAAEAHLNKYFPEGIK